MNSAEDLEDNQDPLENKLEWKLLKENKFPGLKYKEKEERAKYIFYSESRVGLHLTSPKEEFGRAHIKTGRGQWLYWIYPEEMGLVDEGEEILYGRLEEINPAELLDTFETLEKIINYLRPEGVPDI